MDLLWFLTGIVIILFIARYNESNKLFWTLLISFTGSFAVATTVMKITNHNSKEEVKKSVIQTCPTQAPANTLSFLDVTNDIQAGTIGISIPKPVSQELYMSDNTIRTSEGSIRPSDVKFNLIKPPWYDLHISTARDDNTLSLNFI